MGEHRGQDLFRLERDTIGVAGPALMNTLLAARPAGPTERPTFKPIFGRSISKQESALGMRALGQDVRSALAQAQTRNAWTTDLSGRWPQVGHRYLRDLVFGQDPYLLRMFAGRSLQLLPHMTWTSAATVVAACPRRPLPGPFHRITGRSGPGDMSQLAAMSTGKVTYRDRRHAMVLYRRLAAPICLLISTLVTSAMWMGAPFDDDTPDDYILYEAMRLLPPSWNLLRFASPQYPALDDRIHHDDDLLFLNLLSQRDPALWEEPDTFLPQRWKHLDPDNHPGYLPFGHVQERCWGRHMVMPLAALLLGRLRDNGYTVDPDQTFARVPLDGLLGLSHVTLVRRP
ncbi:cytochrome P450 [Kineosporia mesophila]